ncbi:hypothetical protein FPQ18DRAFT_119095 [Pyronema domesticum]|uniref:Uncharacterized protein n=1 Tax=Pyronema omphalodes (strain CBS 100304) TaxID=1076935 RepID=U4LK25_PYROM|nr:hypothetical protein FPQ18DRAFT_119095 [Pyronema domesticum]CCX31912.1 Similar to hypothetical protein [Tuber melanosporum Mel28]; acc. no. XP_002836086 [Pyronema omphalodes CBS 100304]
MITVGQVSGLIAAAVHFLHFTIPVAIVVILVGHIGNENSAATWSVVNRVTQISLWPNILRADTVQTSNVRLAAKILTRLGTLTLLLLTIAGIVTPLGLSDAVQPSDATIANFEYAKDLSSWGQSTPPRPNFNFSRKCGDMLLMNCPGTFGGYRTFRNATGIYNIGEFDSATIDVRLPDNLTEIFTSVTGKEGSTLSGLFDIQYRLYDGHRSNQINGGNTYIQGSFRPVERLILKNAIQAIEGLVIDTRTGTDRTGGIGFRNHTIPVGSSLGATWKEDLTWVQPFTECVDTNLTFQFTSASSSRDTSVATYLVDNGGFADLARSYPYPGFWNDTQNVDLQARAYKAAWLSNAMTAIYLNITTAKGLKDMDPKKGEKYLLRKGDTSFGSGLPVINKITMSAINGEYLDMAGGFGNTSNTTGLKLSPGAQARMSITSKNFTTAQTICAGYGNADYGNIDTIGIHCGYVYGASRLEDGRDTLLFAPNSSYIRNLYVCASAARASIKEVSFLINGTANLDNLKVTSIKPKEYRDPSTKPMWAVENMNKTLAGWGVDAVLQDYTPLWGQVDPKYNGTPGLDFRQSESLVLPATSPGVSITYGEDSLAAKTVFSAGLNELYSDFSSGLPDYTGSLDYSIYVKWKQLTKKAESTGTMIDLIWTDLIASAVVGTKSAIPRVQKGSWMGVDAQPMGVNPGIQVSRYKKVIQYDWRYAIPAILCLLLWMAICAGAAFMWVFSRFNIEVMRQMLNQTSTGRVTTNLLHPNACDPTERTENWQRQAGGLKIRFDNISHQKETLLKGGESKTFATVSERGA